MPRNYDDILHLPHHQSSVRARMTVQARAAQFAPFAALTGYADAIREAARQTRPRPLLAEDALSELDARLRLLQLRLGERPVITATYFVPDPRKPGGAYRSKTGVPLRLDPRAQTLRFEDGVSIDFTDLYAITGDLFPEDADPADDRPEEALPTVFSADYF